MMGKNAIRTVARLDAEVREASDPNAVIENWKVWAEKTIRKKKGLPTSSAYRRAKRILEKIKTLQEQLKE